MRCNANIVENTIKSYVGDKVEESPLIGIASINNLTNSVISGERSVDKILGVLGQYYFLKVYLMPFILL